MAEKMYVCQYKHCQHKEDKIPANKVYLINGKRMHLECAMTQEVIKLIWNTYKEQMDELADYKVVIHVVNQVVFDKGVPVDYVMYWLEEMIKRDVKLKSPYGLHYCMKNKRIYAEWKAKYEEEINKCK